MVLGILCVELEIEHAESLKDKRAVLNRIKDRIRQKFNVSIAETGYQEVWNAAELGIAIVSNEQPYCNEVLSKVLDHIELIGNCSLADYNMEFIQN